MRAVQQIDSETGEVLKVFNTVTAAAKAVGGSKGNISSVCSGKMRRAYGFVWRFAEVEYTGTDFDAYKWLSDVSNAKKALKWIADTLNKEEVA